MVIASFKNIEFTGEFEEETEICSICGADTVLTGWNEEKDISRFECAECGGIFIVDNKGKETIVNGKKRNWFKFLSNNLVFPFDARIDEGDIFDEAGPLRYNDKVVVQKVSGDFDLYGIIAKIKKGREIYEFPLCDLAIDDENSPNYKILDNYRTWFANCR
jgi:ribosomal protein S27AE